MSSEKTGDPGKIRTTTSQRRMTLPNHGRRASCGKSNFQVGVVHTKKRQGGKGCKEHDIRNGRERLEIVFGSLFGGRQRQTTTERIFDLQIRKRVEKRHYHFGGGREQVIPFCEHGSGGHYALN